MATTRTVGVLVLALFSLPAWAGMTWHEDLAAAQAASATSHKPVLAVFTASWSPESTSFEQQVLAAAEVEAVLAACFEPVRIDVDQRPGLTKRLAVSHVPSACVLGDGNAILARFDCPSTSTALVATAARAAQEAASCTATKQPTGDASDVARSLATDERSAAERAATDFPTTPGDGSPLTDSAAPQASGRGSISLVTAKVRQLSSFATGTPRPVDSGTPPPPSSPSLPAIDTSEPPPSRFVSTTPTDSPTLPQSAPSSWPAEPASRDSAFTNAPQQAAAAQAIEPHPAATPWLSGSASAGALPPSGPASSAIASDPPEKSKSTSTWSSFVTAFQKPFSIFSKSEKPAEPTTMPPARPTSPLAATPSTTASPTTPLADSAPAGPDVHGSMPLGLEGYCPVTLAEKGVWTEGRAQWGVRHRGRTYLFAGPEQQQAFMASPDRYAPALSGDDPVAVVDQGKSLPGRRAYGVTYQSRMYLFSSSETRAQFAANPERYTAPVTLAERPAPVDTTRRY
jgi:YHS domain-containing protein